MSLPELWEKLHNASDCKSLLKKNLTEEVYNKYKDVKTPQGGTLKECIQSGTVGYLKRNRLYIFIIYKITILADIFESNR